MYSSPCSINSLASPGTTSPQFFIVALGTLGGNSSEAWGINDLNMVVGMSQVSTGDYHAFIETSGNMRDIGVGAAEVRDINNLGKVVGWRDRTGHVDSSGRPNCQPCDAFVWTPNDGISTLPSLSVGSNATTTAVAINNPGQVVGQSHTGRTTVSGTIFHPYIWTQDVGILDLGTLAGSDGDGIATDINDVGHAVGTTRTGGTTGSDPVHAFLWRTETGMIDLGSLGGRLSSAARINNLNHIVGTAQDHNGNDRAYFWTPETGTINLATLGGAYSTAEGLNDLDQVVGSSETATGGRRGFFWQANIGMIELPSLGGNCNAIAINNGGRVVGFCETASGHQHAVLWISAEECSGAPSVTITNPLSGAIYAVGSPVTFTGVFTDAPGERHTAQWNFDSIIREAVVDESTSSVNVTHTFNAPGVYLVKLEVFDQCGQTGTTTTIDGFPAMVVVYDPDGQYVTGGGWIDSPVGALKADATLSGKASFGVVSKYPKNASFPSGQTEFHFKVGNLNFHSTVQEWLVVAGSRAQYKGTGIINGSGNYGFMVTAIDGQISGGGGEDRFRIKIWDKNNGDVIVYDNQVVGESSDAGTPTTVIGGGGIIIHKE